MIKANTFIYCEDYKGLTHNLVITTEDSECDTVLVMDSLGRVFQYCLEQYDILYEEDDENYCFMYQTFRSYIKQNLEDTHLRDAALLFSIEVP